jgi:ectoine hydroxylase-related dioxygenase (phytanoyl-CoA dioxygenase family)
MCNLIDITTDQAEFYFENGYLVLRGVLKESQFLHQIIAEIEALGQIYDTDFDFTQAQRSLATMQPVPRRNLYLALRYLPSITGLAASPLLLRLSQALGLRMPAVMHSYNVRMDAPNEDKFLFHWHQDITYLLGSLNSITYWLPLSKADSQYGSVAIIPGSHTSGIQPVIYTGEDKPAASQPLSPSHLRLVTEPQERGEVIDANIGDIVLFSQFILHASVPNRSPQVRWTAQIRHSDLSEQAFIEAGYPFGDATNIYHVDYLKPG